MSALWLAYLAFGVGVYEALTEATIEYKSLPWRKRLDFWLKCHLLWPMFFSRKALHWAIKNDP